MLQLRKEMIAVKLIIYLSFACILLIGVSLTITAFLLDYITSQTCLKFILSFGINNLSNYNYTIKNNVQKVICECLIKVISLVISLFFYGYLYFFKTYFAK